MKDYVKIGLVGFACYLIGFYECKYKTIKFAMEALLEEKSTKKKRLSNGSLLFLFYQPLNLRSGENGHSIIY